MNEPQTLTVIKPIQDSTVESLMLKAIEHNVSVETMERLLVMRRELKGEAAKESYDKAMAKFQSECPTIRKTKEVKTRNGQVAYRYAPIESIVEQVKHLLEVHGFSYTTGMELLPTGVKVTVRVTHAAGHSEERSMEVPFGNKTEVMSQSQVAAAATTFAKRYAFCNCFGILTGDEDTDAVEHEQPQQRPVHRPSSAPPPPAKAPQKQSSAAEKPLAERIAIMRKTLGDRAAWAEGYLRNFTVDGSDANCALMPNEKLEDLNLAQVDYLSKKWINFVERVGEFLAENQGHAPHIAAEMESRFDDAAHEPPGGWQGATNARPSGSPIEEEPVKPVSMRPEPPGYACPSCEDGGDTTLGIAPGGHGYIQCRKCGREWENTVKTTTTAPAPAPDPHAEWFMHTVVPVPRKGMKRDTYMQNPDTILSLYSARHSDNEARRRLWGFLNHYEPKGWVNNKGKDMPPSAVDNKFKEALLAFGQWFEQTHPDEKL